MSAAVRSQNRSQEDFFPEDWNWNISQGKVFPQHNIREISIPANAVNLEQLDSIEPVEKDVDIENTTNFDYYIDDESLYEDLDKSVQSRQALNHLNSIFLTSLAPFSLTLSPGSQLTARPGDLVYVEFLLENRGEVTWFLVTGGVGGEVTRVPRERMVFPGEVSFIQTVTPDMVLLSTNESSTISMGVSVRITRLITMR